MAFTYNTLVSSDGFYYAININFGLTWLLWREDSKLTDVPCVRERFVWEFPSV